LLRHLEELLKMTAEDRLKKRYEKFRACGHFLEKAPAPVELAPEAKGVTASAAASPAP